jgi:hypothetical protein
MHLDIFPLPSSGPQIRTVRIQDFAERPAPALPLREARPTNS